MNSNLKSVKRINIFIIFRLFIVLAVVIACVVDVCGDEVDYVEKHVTPHIYRQLPQIIINITHNRLPVIAISCNKLERNRGKI